MHDGLVANLAAKLPPTDDVIGAITQLQPGPNAVEQGRGDDRIPHRGKRVADMAHVAVNAKDLLDNDQALAGARGPAR